MTLEELIRYAIDGMAIDDNLEQNGFASKVQELIDVLIDYSPDTGKDIKYILANYALQIENR